MGEGSDEREEKVRRGGGGRRDERWKLKPCSLIKTGVNFFSPSLRPMELFTMATGEHRGGSGLSGNIRCVRFSATNSR